MKVKLLKKLRKEFSSDFMIVEDPEMEYGCRYKVTGPGIPYHAMSMNSAKEWIREQVNSRISDYVEWKRPRTKRFDADGNEIIPVKKTWWQSLLGC